MTITEGGEERGRSATPSLALSLALSHTDGILLSGKGERTVLLLLLHIYFTSYLFLL